MSGYPMVPSSFMPDNGLAQLAALLTDQGHDVLILDMNTTELVDRLFNKKLRTKAKILLDKEMENSCDSDAKTDELEKLQYSLETYQINQYVILGKELAKIAIKEKAKWIGFKLWNGDGFSGSNIMAKTVKNILEDIKIIAGGSHVDFFGDYLASIDTGFDFFCTREAENSIVAFAEYVEGKRNLNSVPNLFFNKNGRCEHTQANRIEDLNSLPLAVYDNAIYPSLGQVGKVKVGVYEETRGCPHKCAFCNHPLKAGDRLRKKRISVAIKEISELKKKYGFHAFKLGGSYTPSIYMRKLANALIDKEIKIDYCAYGRIDKAWKEDFELYRKAGCRALFFGVETGSQILLDEKIDKGYQIKRCEEILKSCKKAGIYTITSLIYPNPGETDETRLATINLIKRIMPNGAPVHFPILVPGSRWWQNPQKYGFGIENRENCLSNLVSYKVKLFFPPEYWPQMPFTIDRKKFRKFSRETSELTREIEALGVTTLISDDTALIGFYSGKTIIEFRNNFRRLALTGDAEGIQELLSIINENLRKKFERGNSTNSSFEAFSKRPD